MAKEIVVTLDVMLAERKVRSKALAEFVGITEANLSLLKSGKVKGVRFETLARICDYLDCEPGDILRAVPAGGHQGSSGSGVLAPSATSQSRNLSSARPSAPGAASSAPADSVRRKPNGATSRPASTSS